VLRKTVCTIKPAFRFHTLDQDDFWLNQPKVINLIASKVKEQLYGFKRTHVALTHGPIELPALQVLLQ